MDDIDRAQAINEQHLADALANHQRRRGILQYAPTENATCIDCGEPIPAARLAVQPDATRCTDCQNDFEITLRRNH